MPTVKQRKAYKELVENSSNMKQALLRAGYSEATAIKPSQVTKSKGWQELMDEYMPEDLLAEVHADGLRDDNRAVRHKYLDTAYKLRGSYAPEKQQIQVEDITEDSELDQLADKLADSLMDKYVKTRDKKSTDS